MKPRAIKIPTPERLKNIALYYLSRYAASEASLRRVLQNRLQRAQMAHPDFAADQLKRAELLEAIEKIIAAHKASGIVNDRALAEIKVASLRRSGRSGRFIQQKLAMGGLAKELVAKALAEHDGEDEGQEAEMKAALAFCKRRRLGRYRPKERVKEEHFRKDLAALARAGYSVGIIRRVLGATENTDIFDELD